MSLLNRIFRGGEDDVIGRSLQLLMEAVALNSVHLDLPDQRRFQDLFRGHAQELLAPEITPARAMIVTGAAIQTLETFARDTERQIARRTNELCSIGGLLATALAAVCEHNQRIVSGLHGVEKQMLAAYKADEIPALRRKLEQGLGGIRSHSGAHASASSFASSFIEDEPPASAQAPMRASASAGVTFARMDSAGQAGAGQAGSVKGDAGDDSAQRLPAREQSLVEESQIHENANHEKLTHEKLTHENLTHENLTHENLTQDNLTHDNLTQENLVAGVRTGVSQTTPSQTAPPRMPLRQTSKLLAGAEDPVTGLQGRPAAQAAIEDAIKTCMYSAAVPVVVERIQSINTRFGSKCGESVLLAMAQILAQKMGPNDLLFHWQGACLLALIQRTGSAEELQREMARQLSGRVEHAVTVGDRTVLLTGSFSWKVLPLWELTAEEVTERVIRFSLRNGA